MADTTPTAECIACGSQVPKVLSGNLQFTMGKKDFHGPTLGERLADHIASNKAQGRELGRDYESASRWV